jgi:hypothetical protein
MEKICPTCAKDPNSHSFKKLTEKNGVLIFYTKPAKATMYKDRDGILSHINNVLATLGSKQCRVIIDGDGFDVAHALEMDTGIGLIKLITEKYVANVKEVVIINPTWHIKGVIKLGLELLDDPTKSRVKVLDDRTRSVLEFL